MVNSGDTCAVTTAIATDEPRSYKGRDYMTSEKVSGCDRQIPKLWLLWNITHDVTPDASMLIDSTHKNVHSWNVFTIIVHRETGANCADIERAPIRIQKLNDAEESTVNKSDVSFDVVVTYVFLHRAICSSHVTERFKKTNPPKRSRWLAQWFVHTHARLWIKHEARERITSKAN